MHFRTWQPAAIARKLRVLTMQPCMSSTCASLRRQCLQARGRYVGLVRFDRPHINGQTASPRAGFVRGWKNLAGFASTRPPSPLPTKHPTLRTSSQVRYIHSFENMGHRAFIALGSNLGDRVAMIEQACKAMEASGLIRILRTSSLWETTAMYVLDQEKFVNGVCEVATSLSPLELLDELQSIEKRMGRVKVIDKGPRNIDLDILLYDEQTFSNDRLLIPHKLMLEREFVLRPLCE